MPDDAAPLAYLKPLTDYARVAIGNRDALPIDKFPLRVGRESRGSAPRAFERDRRLPPALPTNDLYMRDPNEAVFISRDHFEIRCEADQYLLTDRNSALGTSVEGVLVGGDRRGGEIPLNDQDVIIIGAYEGGFIYKFVLAGA